MTSVDVFLQYFVLWVIVPFIIIYVAVNMFRDELLAFKKQVFAMFMNRFAENASKKLRKEKQKLFADLSDFLRSQPDGGVLLEIGAGSGTNFFFYPDGCSVTCLEYNANFKGYLEKSASRYSHFTYNGLIVADAQNMKVRTYAVIKKIVIRPPASGRGSSNDYLISVLCLLHWELVMGRVGGA